MEDIFWSFEVVQFSYNGYVQIRLPSLSLTSTSVELFIQGVAS